MGRLDRASFQPPPPGGKPDHVILSFFNRALLFETNAYSWHGFPIIDLPPDKQHLSRKSISVYLYSRDRPKDEIAPEHKTFYVQRPLPFRIAAGHVLSDADIDALQSLPLRRDIWIEKYQRDEIRVSKEMGDFAGAHAAAIASHLRISAPRGLLHLAGSNASECGALASTYTKIGDLP